MLAAPLVPATPEDAVERMQRLVELAPDDDPAPAAPAVQIKPFNLEGVHPSVVEAHAAVKKWLKAITAGVIPPFSLTISGRSGCGKTHLAKNAAAYLKQRGISKGFYIWSDVVKQYKADAEQTIYKLSKYTVLILDDVGAENLAGEYSLGLAATALCDVVEKRLGKWTLITSNLTTSEIADRYDARIASRLIRNGGRTVDMTAADDYSLLNPLSRQSANSAAADNPNS